MTASVPPGLIQHGQGKWYPGEPLPRWQIGIVWRHDGLPLWARPELLAVARRSRAPRRSMTPQAFAVAVAERFGLDAEHVVPGYEDPVDVAWREARLPGG